jgi:hypothetical protein
MPDPASASRSASNGRGGSAGTQPPSSPTENSGEEKAATVPSKSHPPITGETKGVLGIDNLNLANANATQGSVLSSEKNNVKLEGGTLLLLRVN